jgi:hypothetical protein
MLEFAMKIMGQHQGVGQIPPGEAGVSKSTGPQIYIPRINIEGKKKLSCITLCAAQFRHGRCGSCIYSMQRGPVEKTKDYYRYGIDYA